MEDDVRKHDDNLMSELRDKTKPKLTDSDPIPIGRYKGTKMMDVPIGFYQWMVRIEKDAPRASKGSDWIRVMDWLRSKG